MPAADVLHVAHIAGDGSFAVGEATASRSARGSDRFASDFLIDSEQLGVERLPVVMRGECGGVWMPLLAVPQGAALVAYGDDGHVHGAEQLIADGTLRASDDQAFPYVWPIASGKTLWVSYRGFTFVVREGAPIDASAARRGVDWGGSRYAMLSLAAHLLMLALFYCSPPPSAAMSSDLRSARSCYLELVSARLEIESDALKRDAYRTRRGADDFLALATLEALASRARFLHAVFPPRLVLDWYDPVVEAPYPTRQPATPRAALDPARPSVASGKPEVSGALSKDTVRRYVQRRLNEIRFCYEQRLQARPDLQGRVSVRFIIGPTGVVQRAAVASSDLADARIEQCVTATVQRMMFPAPEGSAVVSVTYPFILGQLGRPRGHGSGELSKPRAVVKPKPLLQRRP